MARQTFAKDTWGGQWHPDFAPQHGDIVVAEHWGSSAFANADLDLQLKQLGISHVVIVGLLADTCIETTARYAQELGYHVTLVRDATAALKRETMHSAHEPASWRHGNGGSHPRLASFPKTAEQHP